VNVPVEGAVEPGISFFEREDQQDTFKLHLPYIWRTPAEVETLFLPLLNRSAQGLEVQSGLVETEWYSNPVNLILRRAAHSVHFREGDDIAHAILISRRQYRPLHHKCEYRRCLNASVQLLSSDPSVQGSRRA